MAATQKKNVDPSHTIEYQRTVINDMAGDLQSLFVGTAAINAATIQIAGDDIGSISDHINKTIFFYYGGFTADTTIGSAAKVAEIYSHEDAVTNIDDGVTVTIDDGCNLSITDTTSYNFFSNPSEQTNPQKLTGFADNIRTSFVADTALDGNKKVGFVIVPDDCQSPALKFFDPTAIDFNAVTGVMDINIGTHTLKVGDNIKFQRESLIFTCGKDNHATEHAYPRTTDPYYNKNVSITAVTSTTITVNVGISPNTSTHTFVRANMFAIQSGGEYEDDVATEIDDTFTVTVDDGAVLIV